VLARLDEWLDGPRAAGWAVVTGGPGMGKSAILSAWLLRREAAGAVVPHHFIRRQVADWDQPEVIAMSLAAQIEAANPALRDPEAKPERRLLELLGRVSKQLGAPERLVVVVDGLDETRAEPGENPLPRFLPHVLPSGIRFLCATRPTYPHLPWLEARGAVRRLDLDDGPWTASNEAVIRGFWEAAAPGYQPPLPAETLAVAIARAEGNVLHAVMLDGALRDLPAEQRRADRIPRGLKGLIGEVWDQAATHGAVRAGLGLLCAAREALSLDVLEELAGWSYDDKERFLRAARQLLLEDPAPWAGIAAYRPRHEWVRELIAERLGAATVRAHHAALSRALATWPLPLDEARRAYAVRHALAHRIAAGDWSGVRALASNLGYLEARAHAADVFAVEQELTDAGKICPAPALARDLADLARALARESHWIRDDPKGTAGLLWNRLRRLGWTAKDLDARIAIPADAAFLRVRHVVSRESSSLERTLDGHTGWVRACAVTPDGRCVISAALDGTLKVWDLGAGRVLATLDDHAGSVNGCAVMPDGRRVVSAYFDGTVKVWDLEAGAVLATLRGHAGEVTACAVMPDGRRVISASADRTLKIWDLDTGRVFTTLRGDADRVNACTVTPDGRRVVSASDDHTLKVWYVDTGRDITAFDGDAGPVTACTATPDGRRVVSAANDGTLKVWDDTGRMLAALDGYAGVVRACAMTPDGRRAVSGSLHGILKVWDLDAGRALATLRAHALGVRGCAVTSDGRRAVSASLHGILKVWDLDAGWILVRLHGHTGWVTSCAVTPDGQRVVSASHDRTLRVWDLDTGRVLATLCGHTGWVTSCAVTPDGQRVVSGSHDRTLKVWDLDTGRVLATLCGHTGSVTSCAVTPDGRRVVSGSHDRTLKVWDITSGRCLLTHRGDAALQHVVATSGGIIASDRTGTLWFLAWPHASVP
jgi:WD40 repeat protein